MRRIAHRVERGEERVEPGPRGDGGVHALGGDEAEVERRRGGRDHGDGVLDGHEEEKAAPEERRQRVPPQHAGRRAPVGPPPPTRRGGRAHLPPLRAAAVRRLGDRVEDLAAGLLVAPARDSRGGGICAWRGVAWAGVGWAKLSVGVGGLGSRSAVACESPKSWRWFFFYSEYRVGGRAEISRVAASARASDARDGIRREMYLLPASAVPENAVV
jgi:hypothetical protein